MYNYEIYFNELNNTEEKLIILISTNKKAWVEIYILLKLIETKKLWLATNNSFSAWLKTFAKRLKISESLLWHNRQAGKFYEEYLQRAKKKNIEVPPLRKLKVALENLNLIERIANQNTIIADKLIENLIEQKINQKELKATWNTIKTEKILNGEPVTHINGYTKTSSRNISEEEMIETYNKISAKDIPLLITNYNWLPKQLFPAKTIQNNNYKTYETKSKYLYIPDFPIEYTRQIHRINFVIAENYTIPDYNKANNLHLHSIIIILKEEQFINKNTINACQNGTDFFWIITKKELINKLKEELPETIGIIYITNEKKQLYIERIATQTKANENKTAKIQTLCTFISKI